MNTQRSPDYFADAAEMMATPVNAWQACCGDHLGDQRQALCWIDAEHCVHRYSFEQLDRWSAQFAHLLLRRGVRRGQCVAGLLPRRLELLIVILGSWRIGAVYQPLFTAFGPKALQHRLDSAETALLISHRDQCAKLDQLNDPPPRLIVEAADGGGDDFWRTLDGLPTCLAPVALGADEPILMMFTSGTTGTAKALQVPLRALPAFAAYMRYAVDLREDDVLWNIADPGWAYGLYYGIAGPLLLGHSTTLHEAAFNVENCHRLLAEHRISNLMGAPTAFRLLMAAGAPADHCLRVVSSAGEPLNPEVIRWFASEMGVTIHDHYGQTETGMTVCNHHALHHPVRPGSAGFALPGYHVAVVDPTGRPLPAGTPGQLAIDIARSPALFFQGYWRQTQQPFLADHYLTGDTVERSEDGAISFIGRNDDVITSSGYRIGPFEVESSLLEHPDVVEAGVVGQPDPQRTEIVVAYVVLRAGVTGDDALADELAALVKRRLSAHAYPRQIHFVSDLPKTPSGKIQRFQLRHNGSAADTP